MSSLSVNNSGIGGLNFLEGCYHMCVRTEQASGTRRFAWTAFDAYRSPVQRHDRTVTWTLVYSRLPSA